MLAMLLCLGMLLTACNTGGKDPAVETQSPEQTTAQQTQGTPGSDTEAKTEQESESEGESETV